MKKHICPICKNNEFYATAHVAQTWLVDTTGKLVEEMTSCDKVIRQPNDEDIWECANCGWVGAGHKAIKDE